MIDQPGVAQSGVVPWAPPVAGIRWARSLGASAVVTTAAAGAHVMSGGRADATVVALLLAALIPVCWLLAATRLGPSRLAGLLILAQAVVHMASSAGDAAAGGPMLLGHLVATGLSLAALLYGERALMALADRVIAHWFIPRIAAAQHRLVPVALATDALWSRVQTLVVGERAPPVAA